MTCKNCCFKLPEHSLFCIKCGHILLSKENNNNIKVEKEFLSEGKFEEINNSIINP